MLYHLLFFQLFDFDLEVRPLLEVLVGKTVEQALLEVMEEEELASLRRQQVGESVCVGGGGGSKGRGGQWKIEWRGDG